MSIADKKHKAKVKRRNERLKAMQPNNNPQPQPGIQIINFLESFIQLCVTLTGEKPTSLTLTDVMYNAYILESQRHGEVLGLKTGFKNDEPTFNAVKLTKKSPIIVPDSKTEVPPVNPPEKTN